jgi:hypothetical protein
MGRSVEETDRQTYVTNFTNLFKLMTSMPFDTAALHMAEPTNPFPPNTTIYKGTY